MQTHGGAAAEAAITGYERIIRASVQVDWNGNGLFDHPLSDLDPYLDSVSLDKGLKGSAPEELLLIEGSSSAELTVTLNGEYQGELLTNIFSPMNKNSPFYGTQTMDREVRYVLRVETSEGEVTYPQFRGTVRTITPNRADNTVQITALDFAEKMRKLIQLPPWAMSEEHVSYGEIDSQLVRSDWVIANACQLCDTSPSPKRPVYRHELGVSQGSLNGVQVWVSGNGSYLPTIGWVDNLNASTFPNPGTEMYRENAPKHPVLPSEAPAPRGFAGLGLPIQGGPWQYNPDSEGVIRYWAASQDQMTAVGVHYLGFTINTGSGPNPQTIDKHEVMEVILGNRRAIYVLIEDGQVWTEQYRWSSNTSRTLEGQSSKVNIPSGQSHVDVFVQWDNLSSTRRVYVRVGNNTNNGGNWQNIGAGSINDSDYLQSVDQIRGRVSIGTALNISDIYYAVRSNSGRPANDQASAWRPASHPAWIDRGLNRFSHMPSAERREAWSLVQEVAAAEFASVFWDENGMFTFWNWETMLSKRDNIVRTFSLDDVTDLQVTNSVDSVRNVYNIACTKKRSLGSQIIYESQDVNEFYVAPESEETLTVWIDDVMSPLTWVPARHKGANRGYDPNDPNIFYTWEDDKTKHGYVLQFYHTHHGSSNGKVWMERDEWTNPVTLNAFFTAEGNVAIKVVNKGSYPIRLAIGLVTNPGGGEPLQFEQPRPALRIEGTKIIEHSQLQLPFRNEGSIIKYGERTWDLSSDWYQDSITQTRLLDVMLDRTAEPQPTTDAITVAGDPRIQLGDVIRVNDSKGFGEDIILQVYGIKRDFTLDGGLTDTLTVEVVPPPVDPDDPDVPPDPIDLMRVNLCPNPALKNNDEGWWGGSRTTSGTSGMSRSTGYTASDHAYLPKADIEVGKRYVFSAEVQGNGGNRTGTAQIDWYSRSGWMGSAGEVSFSVNNGQTKRIYTLVGTAPAGAEKALLNIDELSGSVIVTAALYEETSTSDGSYFDGDTTGAQWDGKNGNSTSRLMPTSFFGD